MANNRMFLLHRRSGLALYLGKRLAGPWYCGGSKYIDKFFGVVWDEFGQEYGDDDFVLAMESADDNDYVFKDWDYGHAIATGLRLMKVGVGDERKED